MKVKKILSICLLALPLCSCSTKSDIENEIDVLNSECGFILNTKIEDFPECWKGCVYHTRERFHFKETRDDGVDVYTCGTYDYLTTEFYYRDGLQVGFRTRDPQFGFSIFGRMLGSPYYAFEGCNYKFLPAIMWDKNFEHNFDEDRRGDVLPNGHVYSWDLYVYKEKIHLNFSREPEYSFNDSLREFEVFVDK